ncbi:MAG: carboxymuconolactone decarboxylase family protein, partial [Planctomycetes bacterium]|nr:carboxymuconolactone decarboxylase family protein [Planctomycetota bacterium]
MAPRIKALTNEDAPDASRTILRQIDKAIGMVPNLHRTLAHAPAALSSYVVFSRTMSTGILSPSLREKIAMATASINECGYCASAHAMLGKGA